MSRNPIFQVMLVLQSAPKSDLQLPGLTVEFEPGGNESALFDLHLAMEERGEQILGNLNYARDLFDRETVERWIECFKVLLQGIAQDSWTHVAALPFLPQHERLKVVQGFNATAAPFPQHKLVHHLFEEQVARTPESIAVEHGEGRLSYAELNRRANQLARYLLEQGVGPDQPVGLCVERGLGMVISLLGILKAGSAYVPLDPNYPPERLSHMLEDARPKVILTQARLLPLLPATAAQIVDPDTVLQQIGSVSQENLPQGLATDSGRLVYLIYTSGSTGRPKGTAMPHRAMVNLMEWHRREWGAAAGRRVSQFAALSFDVALQEIFSTLSTGGTLVLLDECIRKDASALVQLFDERRIGRLFVPPLMLQSLAEACAGGQPPPRTLQDIICAGEQLHVSAAIQEFFRQLEGCRLHNHYGPTETHVVTALTLTGDPAQWPDYPSIGRPITNTQIYILDVQRQPVPIGVTGEIYVGGAGLARGYLNQSD